ncbi:uncharacterized protein LOC108675516 [Hyalella azteca]|uniref:Uncharacterized protein LOC108675516 n=1 Tax=Hyalella azteca TaxID=294128 RepID=A0A8B7NZA1_HYAAZ|nr:uncharacterized protein LOC108675516 [Hyalella azteca]
MAQISSTIQRHESALDRDIRLYLEKTSTAPKVEVKMLTAKNDYSANSSNLSASTNEAKNHVAQSIMGYIMVQLFEFTRIVRRLFQNFISLAFAPSHVTDSLSANILEQLNILEENFQEFSDVVALNVAATWQAFLKTQPQKVKIESLRKIKTLVREINLGLDSLHRRLTQHLSLNDAVFYLHHSLTVLNKIAGPFNNKLFSNIFSSHVWVSNFISGNIVNEICESKNHWEKNSLEITAGALRNILSSFGNFVDEYLLYLNLNAIFSTIDAEMIRQAIDFSCFYINEVAGVEPIGIKNILNKNNSSMVPYSEDVETSGGDRLLVRNRRMLGGWDDLFDINVFTERVKELPFMQKEWNFGKMLESMKKSMNIAWLALASGDAKVLTIASFGDILSPALNSGSDLHKQCSDLIGKLQFYRRSTLKDMEGLMRILLERATALKCYELGSSDPILRRLQFLLNILKTKRNVVEDPDDPLNIAKRRMEVAMLDPSRRKLH